MCLSSGGHVFCREVLRKKTTCVRIHCWQGFCYVGKGSVMLARVQSGSPFHDSRNNRYLVISPLLFRLVRARWGMCPISRGRISFITNFPDTKFRLVRLGTPWWEKEPTTTRPAGGCDSYRAIVDSCRQHQHVACYDRSVCQLPCLVCSLAQSIFTVLCPPPGLSVL